MMWRKSKGDASSKKTTRSEGDTNPWLTSRRTWNDLFSGLISSRQNAQIVAILSMLIALSAVGGLIYIGQQSKFVPFLMKVDSHGVVMPLGPAHVASRADPRIVHAAIAEFVADARLVTPDVSLQRRAIFRIYSKLSPKDPATATMNEWLNGNADSSPFKRAAKEMVSTEIKSVLFQTGDTWQIEWDETKRDRQGVMIGKPEAWRVLVTVYTGEPTNATTEEQLLNNPMGVYVRAFSWSRIR